MRYNNHFPKTCILASYFSFILNKIEIYAAIHFNIYKMMNTDKEGVNDPVLEQGKTTDIKYLTEIYISRAAQY